MATCGLLDVHQCIKDTSVSEYTYHHDPDGRDDKLPLLAPKSDHNVSVQIHQMHWSNNAPQISIYKWTVCYLCMAVTSHLWRDRQL